MSKALKNMNIKSIVFIIALFTTGSHINGMREYQRPFNKTCLKQIFELNKSDELADNMTQHYDIGTASEAHQSLMASFKITQEYSEKQILYIPKFNQFTERLRSNYANRLANKNDAIVYSKCIDLINKEFPMMEMPVIPAAQTILAEKRSPSPVREESQPKRVRIDEHESSNNQINEPALAAPSTELQKLHDDQKKFMQLFTTSLLPKVEALMGKLDAIATKVDGMDARIVKLENRFKN
jgi:hypothetical protein